MINLLQDYAALNAVRLNIGGVFTNEENQNSALSLLAALPILYKLVVADFDRKSFDLTRMQFFVFAALYQYEPLSMTEIASYISASKEQATRVVAPLVDAGFAERQVDPSNRTRIRVHLTETGREFFCKYRQQLNEHLNQLYDEYLTPEEQDELNKSLHSVIHILRKMK